MSSIPEPAYLGLLPSLPSDQKTNRPIAGVEGKGCFRGLDQEMIWAVIMLLCITQ